MRAGVFAIGEFRTLWTASLFSIAGDQLARVALSILVFDRTQSAAWTALTYALTMLPNLVSGVLLSGLADRFPRRTVMVVSDLVRAGLVGLMAIPGTPLVLVAGLLVLVQLAEPPFAAAQGALLPEVLGERYEDGQSVHLVTHQAGLLAGFAGGGVVVALLGTSGALAVDAATFALSAVLLRFGLKARPAPQKVERTGWAREMTLWWGQIRDGARLVWTDRKLRALMLLGWLALFSVVPEGLAAPFAAQIGVGAAAVGLLLAADPAGMIVGAFALRFLPSRARWLGVLAVFTSLPLLGYLLAPNLVFALVLLALSGAASAYQITAGATFVQLVPPERRGQALGFARSGLIAAQGIGVALGGVVASWTGSAAVTIAAAGAAGTVLALAAAAAWSRT